MFTLDLSCVRELKDYLTCVKCGKLSENPRKNYNCGHIICQKCINACRSKCPKCHSSFMERDVEKSDVFIRHMLAWVQKIDAEFAGTDYLIKDIPVDLFKQETDNDDRVKEKVHSDQLSWSQDGWYVCDQLAPNPIRRTEYVMKRNPKGESPLHIACKRGMLHDVSKLVAKGVDVNVTDWANWTPLHEAVQSKSVQCVEFLLSKGALVDVTGEDYRTPLFQSVTLANEDIVKLLLQYGAKNDALDYSGLTPTDVNMTSSVSDILISTKPKDVLPKRSLYYQNGTVIFILNVDTVTISKLSNSKYTFTKETHTKDIYLCVLGKSVPLYHHDVLTFISRGVMIIREDDLENYLSIGLPYRPELIPREIRSGLLKSIRHHLEKKPSLFDGMNFHIFDHSKSVQIEGTMFSKDDLVSLIKAAEGTVLVRAPAERTLSGTTFYPYHCQQSDVLKTCCNFIVYSEKDPPLLLYNMAELRHVSSRWIVKCLFNYEISF